MQVPRRILVTCLVGAVGVSAVPLGAVAAAAPDRGYPITAVAAGTTTPTLAPSLRQLLAEVNSRWPGRSTASDGWLGDPWHQLKRSDHNPVGHPNGPSEGTPGRVHALDITSSGIDASAVVGALLGDSRVWYVIYNRTIWSRTSGWVPRTYSGDPHSTHVHVSLLDNTQASALAAEGDTSPWLGKLTAASSGGGSLGPAQVRALQQALITRGFAISAGATGTFGAQTKSALAAFQRSQGWRGSGADGSPGPRTLERLGVSTASAVAALPTVAASASTGSANYAPGARGTQIVALQKALIARGFAIPSGATGKFGAETRRAVAAFQSAQGWRGSGADGLPGAKTLALLGLSGTPVPAAAVVVPVAATSGYSVGARGGQIVQLQRALINAGQPIKSGPTGWFGPETQKAVAAFQRAQGWTGAKADGLPGPVTLRRLGLG